MHTPQSDVRKFHEAFKHPTPAQFDPATFAKMYRFDLRKRLIYEEAMEFHEAADNRDVVAMIDAICDLLYVTYGAAVELGIDVEPFFRAVHESNMAKLFPDGKPHYREDGKTLKPPGWKPPDIEGLFRVLCLKGR